MDHRNKMLEKKRVGELKRLLRLRKVDYSDCVEKADLIQRVILTDKDSSKTSDPAPKVNKKDSTNNQSRTNARARGKRNKGRLKKKTRKDLAKEYLLMGIKCKNEGKRDQAMVYYRKGLENNIEDPVLWYNLGVCFAEEGKMSDARDSYLKAVQFEPKFCFAQNNLGAYYKDQGELDKAVYHYKKALDADPKFSTALNNLSVTYHVMGLLGEAQQACEKAIKLSPKSAEAFNNLGTLYLDGGRVEDAVRCFSKCISLDPEKSFSKYSAFHNRLLAMNSLPAFDEEKMNGTEEDTHAQKMWDTHNDWAEEFEDHYDEMRYMSWDNDLNPHRPIRVGYLSSDFRTHPVSYFIEGPLKYMDETQVVHYCYMAGPPFGDKRTADLQKLIPNERWRMLGSMSLLEICEMMRRDEIDILVELGGHSSGQRLDIMVLKPAPVQVTWIGYANTTGLTAIDYRITDSVCDPPHTKQLYSEDLVRMPDPCAFLCYTGSPNCPDPKDTPALKNGYLTFGCFNTLGKVTNKVFALWCTVLKKNKKSRILLKCKALGSTIMRKEWIGRFKQKGVSADRITLLGYAKTRIDHLNCYNRIDIQLDPFPYGGTTTTFESIWMGVPVLTLQRVKFPIHAQNVASSIFTRIPDLKEGFIAKTKQEYINISVGWGKKLGKLNKLRLNLRKNFEKSSASGGPEGGPIFCQKLAEVYREMWSKYCQEKKDALFDME